MSRADDVEDKGVVRLASYGGDDSFEAFLLLRPELSATMDSAIPDGSLAVFALGVVPGDAIKDENGKWTVLPGPQSAFAREEYGGISDVEKFLQSGGNVNSDVVESFRTWTDSNPFRGSLVSFPLRVPKEEGTRRIGVLTIYSDDAGVIGGTEGRWQIFGVMMRPYMDGVATLLQRLEGGRR